MIILPDFEHWRFISTPPNRPFLLLRKHLPPGINDMAIADNAERPQSSPKGVTSGCVQPNRAEPRTTLEPILRLLCSLRAMIMRYLVENQSGLNIDTPPSRVLLSLERVRNKPWFARSLKKLTSTFYLPTIILLSRGRFPAL